MDHQMRTHRNETHDRSCVTAPDTHYTQMKRHCDSTHIDRALPGGSQTHTMRVRLLKATGITALAFLLSLMLVQPLSFSVTSLFSAPEKDEYTISDFYANIANRRPVRVLRDDIVIVDIDQMDRDEIAGVLDVISLCGPAVVGVDVMFAEPGDSLTDARLIDAIRANAGKIVMPVALEAGDSGETFESALYPFFRDSVDNVIYAATNLPSNVPGGTIREFAPGFELGDSVRIPSFAAALASVSHPGSLRELEQRGNRHETIDYPSNEYIVIPADQLYDRAEELAGKIVLVGSLNDVTDMHAAPINSYLSGVYIHAAAVNTIVTGRYYSASHKVADWVLACLLCFIVSLIGLIVSVRVKGLVNRLLQLLMVYVVVQLGYMMYVNERVIINFSYTLLMITFGLFAGDIWNGTHGLYLNIRDRRMRKRAEKQDKNNQSA